MKRAFRMPIMSLTAVMVIASAFLFPHAAGSVRTIEITGIRHWSSEQYTRVVVDADGPVHFTRNVLKKPDRLYFDLRNSRLQKKSPPSVSIRDGILKSVRSGQFKNNVVRVVLDLHEIANYNVFLLENPYRLVIDVFGLRKSGPSGVSGKPEPVSVIKRVIIDPGHGGKDPGAIGPNGLKEKDVVLAVAKKLRTILEKKYNMEVIFTRDRDVFIPLEERTAIANSRKGDLFISIHANANRRKKVRGIETYFLNWTTDKESLKVAARENAISVSNMRKAQSSIQMILQDLERENKKEESMSLAHSVQSSLVGTLSSDYSKIVDLGVKYAFFYVLVGAEMPSVLVEISYISNREEAYRLSKRQYRDKIAHAIAKGIQQYAAPSTLVKHKRDTH